MQVTLCAVPSAIGTVSGVIHPSAKDKGISITTVNLTGTVLMITLPFLTGALYGNETMQTSAMIGGNFTICRPK